jgi:DnaJ-class molecular chaperone
VSLAAQMAKSRHMRILGLDRPGAVATNDAIQTAYKRSQIKWHPDRHHDPREKKLVCVEFCIRFLATMLKLR